MIENDIKALTDRITSLESNQNKILLTNCDRDDKFNNLQRITNNNADVVTANADASRKQKDIVSCHEVAINAILKRLAKLDPPSNAVVDEDDSFIVPEEKTEYIQLKMLMQSIRGWIASVYPAGHVVLNIKCLIDRYDSEINTSKE